MRLLITGAGGMLGHDVVAAAHARGHEVTGVARAELDITDGAAVAAAVERARPDAIVNCAAWTDVDGAEAAEAAATAVNGDGPARLAETGVRVVHVSSDYVFAGDATEPYPEDAPTGPRTAYGRSKLAGEAPVLDAGGAVVRSSWLFGAHGPNFVATMRRLAAEGAHAQRREASAGGSNELSVVADQVGSPTFTGHLAPALIDIAEQGLTGIHHVAGAGSCSWHDLAAATFAATGADVRLSPCTTAEFPRPAPRPAYSVLGVTRAETPRLPDWRDGLRQYLAS
jgi:dTDP-4-dehydrorhamnose reductase